jgi:hypothetical protein
LLFVAGWLTIRFSHIYMNAALYTARYPLFAYPFL